MCFYIGIEDLAANALIEILAKGNGRFVTYQALEDYGAEVITLLKEKGKEAVLILSRDRTNAMFHDYSDFFEEKETPEGVGVGITLKDGIEIKQLIETFRGYLVWDILKAFMDKKTIAKLGVAYA